MCHPKNPGNTPVYGPAGVWKNDKGCLSGMVIWSSLMKSILMEAAMFLFVFLFFLQKPQGRIWQVGLPYPSLRQQISNVVLDFPVLTGGGGEV